MTRLELIPKQLEELLHAASLPRNLILEVRPTWMRILRWFSMLDLVDFGMDLLDATGEGARAEKGVYHATLEMIRQNSTGVGEGECYLELPKPGHRDRSL